MADAFGLSIEELSKAIRDALESGKYTTPMKDPDARGASKEVVEELLEILGAVQKVCGEHNISLAWMLEHTYDEQSHTWESAIGVTNKPAQSSPHFDSVQELAAEGHEAALPALLRWVIHRNGGGTTTKIVSEEDDDGNVYFTTDDEAAQA